MEQMENTREQTGSKEDYFTENKVNNETQAENVNNKDEQDNTNNDVQADEKNGSQDDEKELAELLAKHKQIEEATIEEVKKQMEQHIEDSHNNLNIFLTWAENNSDTASMYKNFVKAFDAKYRSDLFENMCEFFTNTKYVTDDMIFFWKCITISLLKSSKKYRSYLQELVLDMETKTTNFRLVREKYIFRCFISDEHVCYFKENGNDYYVS